MSIPLYIQKKYSGQGFIEALVAILIAGIAVVALMSVTTRTLSEVVRNEMRDQVTQEGVWGGVLLQYIVERKNLGEDIVTADALFDDTNIGSCFELDGNLEVVESIKVENFLCNLIPDPDGGVYINECLEGANWNFAQISKRDAIDEYDYSDKMFRIVCIAPATQYPPISPSLLVAKIYTGTEECREYDHLIKRVDSTDTKCILNEYTSVHPLLYVP